MSAGPVSTPLHIGFLTILQESAGFLGGYLVTNQWGRPLEFRLSTAVQPNRVHQILYGGTLRPYICSDLIGKTLVERTATPVQMVVTDNAYALDLRQRIDAPVAWVALGERVELRRFDAAASHPAAEASPPPLCVRGSVYCHPRYPDDVARINELLSQLVGVELMEPFQRIREAIAEARKMGVGLRAA